METQRVHPVDERLPLARLFILGLQHVLVMYGGAVAVPLIVGGALHLSKDMITLLINADLFACGIITLIQCVGFWKFGVKLPVMMGVTFTAVGPTIAIGANPELGLAGIYGAGIASGVIGILAAPIMGRLMRFFPPVVTGTVITLIGVTLVGVGVNWAAGDYGNPNFGDPLYLSVSLLVLVSILMITKFTRGFIQNIAVMLGVGIGFAVAFALGKVHFDGMEHVKWFAFVTPFQFGLPKFEPISIATMTLVMLVTFVESTGMFIALGDITGKTIDRDTLVRGLRCDGLGAVVGGIFNTFPYTSFSENVGLVGITGVRSRWVCAMGGGILLTLALIPKMAFLVASIPAFVLGGAGIVMFGMVASAGIKVLSNVDFKTNHNNLYIVAISVGFGMIPMVAPQFFSHFPAGLKPILDSGILLATVSAVGLNAFFNGVGAKQEEPSGDMAAAQPFSNMALVGPDDIPV